MITSRAAWATVGVLAILQIGLAQAVATRAGERSVTYVLTPMVDVVPGGVPLTAGEAADLASQARNQVDARDIQKAYGKLGSTLSLDDLLRGVEGLEASGALSGEQRARVRAVLDAAQRDHAAVYAVQEEILTLEAQLAREAEAVLAALPAETRARVEARASAGEGAKRPGGSRGAAPGGAPNGPPAPGGAPAAPGGAPNGPPAPGGTPAASGGAPNGPPAPGGTPASAGGTPAGSAPPPGANPP